MAKRIIEFDDENLGCRNCPYLVCKDDPFGDLSDYSSGYYCRKYKKEALSPGKFISELSAANSVITTPDWCKLYVKEDKFIDFRTPSVNIVQYPTTDIVAQIELNPYAFRQINTNVEAFIKDEIAFKLAHSPEFINAIEFSEISGFNDNIRVRGKIKLVTK